MRVDALEKLDDVGTAGVDLAERGRVHDAERLPRREALARHGRVQVFAVAGEVPRAVPLPDVFHRCAGGDVPLVDRGLAHRVVQVADALSGADPERYGRIRRAERGRADFRDRLAQAFREHRHAVYVAQLALVGTETQRRVALDVLDVAVTFANREAYVGDARVVLEIEELLRTALRLRIRRYAPERLQRVFMVARYLRQLDVRCVETAMRGRRPAGFDAFAEAIPQ